MFKYLYTELRQQAVARKVKVEDVTIEVTLYSGRPLTGKILKTEPVVVIEATGTFIVAQSAVAMLHPMWTNPE